VFGGMDYDENEAETPQTVSLVSPKQPETMPETVRNSGRNSLVKGAPMELVLAGEDELDDYYDDSTTEALPNLEAKLEQLKKKYESASGSCRSLNSRSLRYELEGKKEEAISAIKSCEVKRQEAEQIKAEIAALKDQIRNIKKFT